MPHAVVEVRTPIIALDSKDVFFSKKSPFFIMPMSTKCEDFIIRSYQKDGKIIVKLDKTTYPLVTDDVKRSILEFAEYLANNLNGKVIHHNLKEAGKDCVILKSYLLDVRKINKRGINDLLGSDRIRVEVGIGKGEFLLKAAKSDPNVTFVGIEIANEPLSKAVMRFYKEDLNNIKIVKYDARYVFDLFKANSIERVYVNFPEPWFKFKRLKHALLNVDTLKKIERVLKKDGTIELLTDNLAYAVSVATALETCTGLRSVQSRCVDVFQGNIDTYFERRWKRKRRTIYSVTYRKQSESNDVGREAIDFPLKIKLDFVLESGLIFKILDVFENSADQRIVEVTFGRSINPQHSYFGLTNTNELFLIPQSIFVADNDALKSLQLAAI